MAKPLLKIQRYFRRKPVRFFSLILLYLTAGSLVFLHSGFVGDSSPGARAGRDSVVAAEMGSRTSLSDARGLGIMSRVFKETRRSGRRFGPPWMKKARQENPENARTTINSWISNKTENLIQDTLPPGALDSNTILVLVNTIYFKVREHAHLSHLHLRSCCIMITTGIRIEHLQ